jgi:hypothetical protein
MAEDTSVAVDARQRRHMRRTALLLGLLAVAVYAAYIVFALTHGHR